VADPQNLFDAAFSAAVYLCRSGPGLGDDSVLRSAYLTYNNGWNCVVTVSNTPGQRDWMKASIELSSTKGGGWIDDEDYYTKYAGPVYVYAPSACIDWGGTVGYKGSIWLEWNDHCG
jgi:hypothetical protein